MAHGVRPHMARDVPCDQKVGFTTYDAAMSLVVRVPGAERPIRGSCCGMWHITGMTQDDYAKLMASQGCTDAADRGRLDLSPAEYLEEMDREEARRAAVAAWAQSRGSAGGPGAQAVERGATPRPAPTPAAIPRRRKARSDA